MTKTPISYSNLIGFLAAFPIFNQIDVGTNVSLLWMVVLAAPVIYGFRPSAKVSVSILFFLALVLLKFLVAMNGEAILRYFIYIAFLAAAMTSLRQEHLDELFYGLEWGLACSVVFGCIQMVGILTGSWTATFPVELWNPFLWQQNLPSGMIPDYPRVSGFANEPAYFGILMIASASYRMFIKGKKTVTGWYGLYLFFTVILLVNSRTTFSAYGWVLICAVVLTWRNRVVSRVASIGLYVVSFFLFPAILWFRSDGTYNYMKMMLDDVSIFARTAPLIWIREGNHLFWSDYIFGVSNYREFSPSVTMPSIPFHVLQLQGGLLDPKSLGAAYFYDLGIVGAIAFAVVIYISCRGEARRLLLFSTVNISFFNVYAFSWPLFWIMVLCCCSPMRVTGTLLPNQPLEGKKYRQRNRRFVRRAGRSSDV